MKLIFNSEKYDHALQQAAQPSEARELHQLEEILHQNRKTTQNTAVKHLNSSAQLLSKILQTGACKLHR